MARKAVDFLPEPNFLGPAPGAVGNVQDPFVSPPSLTAAEPRFQQLEQNIMRIAGSLARQYAETIQADRDRAHVRAQNVGTSDETLAALQDKLKGAKPGTPEEARAVEDFLARQGVERVADRVTAEKAIGDRAALVALGPIAARVRSGEFARDPRGTALLDSTLADARGQAIGAIPGETARQAFGATYNEASRRVREEALQAAAVQRRNDAKDIHAGEFAAGSPDGGRRGAGGLSTAGPEAQAEILQEMAETVQYAEALGHRGDQVALEGISAAIDAAPSAADGRRILHVFTTRFKFPNGQPVQKPDGTITGPSDFVQGIVALDRRVEDNELREVEIKTRREDVVRTRLARRLRDEAASAGIQADRMGRDYRPAAARALKDFLGTPEGAEMSNSLDPDTIIAMSEAASQHATELVNGEAQASTAAKASATRAFEDALARRDLVAARAIADGAPGATSIELNARLESTDPATLQAVGDAVDPVRQDLAAASAEAVKLGDRDSLDDILELEGQLDNASRSALATPGATPEVVRTMMEEAVRPLRLQAQVARRNAQQRAAAGNALEDQVGPMLLTDPKAAIATIGAATGVPSAVKNRLLERAGQHQAMRQNAVATAENRIRAEVRDLAGVLTEGRDLTPADMRRIEATALAKGRESLNARAAALTAAGATTGDLLDGLLDSADGIVLESLQAAVPGLESLELTAEQQVARAALQETRAAALAVDPNKPDTGPASQAAGARIMRAAGLTGLEEAPPHLQRLQDTVSAAIANRGGQGQVPQEIARFWLQARGDEERAAGVQAALTSGALSVEDVATGRIEARATYNSTTAAAGDLQAMAAGGDLDPDQVRALQAGIEGLKGGGTFAAEVGPFQVQARRTQGFLGFGSVTMVTLSTPFGKQPPGAVVAIQPPADYRADGGTRMVGPGLSMKFKTAAEVVAGMTPEGRTAVANALGLDGPNDAELAAALRRSFDLARSYE